MTPHEGLDLEAMSRFDADYESSASQTESESGTPDYFTAADLYALLKSLARFLDNVCPMFKQLASEVQLLQETYESVHDKLRKINHRDTTKERREEARQALANFPKSGVTQARQLAVRLLLAATRESMVGGIIQDIDIVWNTKPLHPDINGSVSESLLIIRDCISRIYSAVIHSEQHALEWLDMTRVEHLANQTNPMDIRELERILLKVRNWRAGALNVAAELIILPVKVSTILAALSSRYGAKQDISVKLKGLMDEVVRKITNNMPDNDREVFLG
eukprot:Colp12_sorted_trinity150504_noHs@12668